MSTNPLLSSFTGLDDDAKIRDESSRLVWSTEKINKLIAAMDEGYTMRDHPFYDGDIKFRKGDTVFEYTDWELNEIRHCAKDIIYFANTYCKVMTDEGYKQITLRPYQEKVLRSYQNNRWNIFMAARQIGKCHTYTTKIKVKYPNGKIKEVSIGDFYYSVVNPSLIGRIKTLLYKILEKLED